MPVNRLNSRQKFHPDEHVRVLVAEPPSNPAAVNRLPNTSGAWGSFGWVTDKPTEVLEANYWGLDPRYLDPSLWAARVSGLTGSITVLSATDILVTPTETPPALGFDYGLTSPPGLGLKVHFGGIPQFTSGGIPILWEVVTTPAVSDPPGTPWRLTQSEVAQTPGSISPVPNAWMASPGAYYRAEFQQASTAETNVQTTIRSTNIGVTPGEQIAMGLTFMGQPLRTDTGAYLSATTRQLWVNYYKADGTFLSQVVQTAATIAAGVTTVSYAPGAVPAGAAFATMNLRVAWPTDIFGVDVEARMTGFRFQRGTNVLLAEEFPTFRNIFPGSRALTIDRGWLDASAVTLTTSDPECDPATTFIRKGAAAIIEIALSPSDNANDRLFTGYVDDVAASYAFHKGELRPVTAVTFSDGNALLANTTRRDGYAALHRLVEVMEGSPVPYNITGQTGIAPSTDPPDWSNDNASAIDQIAVTRDTNLGYAYLDRWGVMNVHSEDGGTGTIWAFDREWDVDESNFNATTAIAMSFASVINTVSIVAYRQIGDQTEEWNYGPFVDQASVDEFGARKATFTVGVPVGAVVSATYWDAFVAEIFAKNASAAPGFEELPFFIDGITSDTPYTHNSLVFASADLGDLLNVTSPALGLTAEPFRISRVRHEITPEKWIARFGIAKPDGVAAPTVQPDLGRRSEPGWIPITLLPGFTATSGLTPEVSSIGDIIFVRGEVQGTFAAGASVSFGTLPAGYRPVGQNYQIPSVANNAEGRIRYAPNGNIDARFAEATTFANICATFRRN